MRQEVEVFETVYIGGSTKKWGLNRITCTTCGCYTYQSVRFPWYDKSGSVMYPAAGGSQE